MAPPSIGTAITVLVLLVAGVLALRVITRQRASRRTLPVLKTSGDLVEQAGRRDSSTEHDHLEREREAHETDEPGTSAGTRSAPNEEQERMLTSSAADAGDSRVTLAGLARLSGVSKAIVARVLRDAPNIDAKTRQRVLEVSAATGYTPPQTAARLRRSGADDLRHAEGALAEADEEIAQPDVPTVAPAGIAAPTATAAQLQFTSYCPREVPALQWHTLLVYAHTATALSAVRADATRFAEELGERPRAAGAVATQTVERGTLLTVVPSCAGVRFNPERLSLAWDEEWHRGSVRFQADADLAGSAAAGEITVYIGPLILAVLKRGLLVSEAAPVAEPVLPVADVRQETAAAQSVFASYSHDDTAVVLACRNAYRALGLTVNIDMDTLRAGDQWDSRLLELIAGSDIFQLFWSAHAAASPAVEREWRYALAHSRGPGYIRPVYWEQPLIPPPAELTNLHFAFVDLPR